MIYYEANCSLCKQPFKLIEGTDQYKQYKVKPHAHYMCADCKRKIEDDSRKYLFNRD